jgi:outer membrane protein assembly factor BamB
MYANAGESGLSSPAIVNDVVFCTTSKVSIYAFDVRNGRLLWSDDLGSQTDGYNGGYGYCLGPAIWQNYVVGGALVFGRDGGVLKIYGLTPLKVA